MENPNR